MATGTYTLNRKFIVGRRPLRLMRLYSDECTAAMGCAKSRTPHNFRLRPKLQSADLLHVADNMATLIGERWRNTWLYR